MVTRFHAGLALSAFVPWLCWRLRQASALLDPTVLTNVATGSTSAPAPVATQAPLAVAPADAGRPPILEPESRPEAKAGEGRRAVQVLPCHDCNCCTVYATRLRDAHAEIDRLRGELVVRDGRRINTTGRDPEPFGTPRVAS